MEFDDRAADGQTDAHAFRLGGVERGKNLLDIVFVETVPLVGYRYFEHPLIDRFGLDGQAAALEGYIVHRFNAIFQQIEQDLLDHDVIDDDTRQIFGNVDDDLRTGALCLDIGKGARLVN